MQSTPIAEGIEAVMKFCNDFRNPETIKQYSKACDAILTFSIREFEMMDAANRP